MALSGSEAVPAVLWAKCGGVLVYIRVRVEEPERNIGVPGCVDVDGAGYDQSVRVQTRPHSSLTGAACLPDLTIQEYKGGSVCEREFRECC